MINTKCPLCLKEIDLRTEFRDSLSIEEYKISGICQKCQDEVFEEIKDIKEEKGKESLEERIDNIIKVLEDFNQALSKNKAILVEPNNAEIDIMIKILKSLKGEKEE